jgi:hypothetical protein
VVGLKLEYYDGLDWYDSWGEDKSSEKQPDKKKNSARDETNLSGLPEAVRITLLLDSNPKRKNPDIATSEVKPEPPFIFKTVVRLNLAAASQTSSDSSDTGNSDNNSSPGQMPGNGGNN